MEGLSLPMSPDDERLWLVGLVGFAVVVLGAAVAWNAVPSGTATVRVTDVDDPVTVTVERADGGVVARERVESGVAVVYRTSDPGRYVVTVDHDDWTCDRRYDLVREDRKLARTHAFDRTATDCGVGLEMDVSPF
jgi:hypothetical protein